MPKYATRRLTQMWIDQAMPPRKGFIEKPDGMIRGLRLKISQRGKTYKLTSKGRRLIVGKHPAMTLEEARLTAMRARESGDPAKYLKGEGDQGPLFKEICEKYLKLGLVARRGAGKGQRLKSAARIEARIRRHLIPVWGDRPVSSLEGREATAVLDRVTDEAGPDAARILYQNLQAMMRWSKGRDTKLLNPFEGLEPPVGNPGRDRVLSDDEITAIWRASYDLRYSVYGSFIRLLIATGARRNEISELHAREIGDDLIIIPATRSKNKVEYRIPLTGLIADEIAELEPNGYLLTTTSGARSISSFSKIKDELSERCSVKDWRFHDIRRSVRSNLADLDVVEEVAERVLHHLPASKMTRVYNKHKYDKQVREALTKWHARLREWTTPPPENVVRLKG